MSVLSSGGEVTGDWNLELRTAYSAGVAVTDVVRCQNYTVGEKGTLTLQMGGGEPHVLFPSNRLNGSRLCGFGDVSMEGLMTGGAGRSIGRVGMMTSVVAVVGALAVAFALV